MIVLKSIAHFVGTRPDITTVCTRIIARSSNTVGDAFVYIPLVFVCNFFLLSSVNIIIYNILLFKIKKIKTLGTYFFIYFIMFKLYLFYHGWYRLIHYHWHIIMFNNYANIFLYSVINFRDLDFFHAKCNS